MKKVIGLLATVTIISNCSFAQTVEQYGDTMFSPGPAGGLKMARCGGVLYAAFSDATNSGKASVWAETNPQNWALLGPPAISQGTSAWMDIVNGAGNFPVIAYTDAAYSNKLIVRQWDGASWNALGSTAGITGGPVSDIALTFNYSTGFPSVAFKDPSTGGKITVFTWNGVAWNAAGTPGFSAGAVAHVDIQFSSAIGDIVVAYKDSSTLRGHAQNFNGSSWVPMAGADPFTGNEIKSLDLEIDSISMFPLFAVSEFDGTNFKASVYVYNGSGVNSVGTPMFSPGPAASVTAASDMAGVTVAAFRDISAGGKITVMHSAGGSWVPSVAMPSGPVGSCDLVAAEYGNYYVAYTDSFFGAQVNVRKLGFPLQPTGITPGGLVNLCPGNFVNLTTIFQSFTQFTWIDSCRWDTVGGAAFTTGPVNDLSYACDPYGNGQAVAIRDGSNGNKLAVYHFINPSWVTLGPATLSTSSVAYPKIKMDNFNMPIVAFRDDAASLKASVLRYNGSTWVNVGTPGFSQGNAQEISLDVDKGNRPVVAYKDVANANKLTVMYFNGTNWVSLGGPGFTPGQADMPCVKVSPINEIFVSYSDQTNGGKATLKKWTGTNWIDVGLPGFSAGAATFVTIDFDLQHNIYAAFADGPLAGKITVMKYDNVSWSVVGPAGFTPGNTYNIKVMVDPTGVPHVSYIDNYLSANRAIIQKYNGASWDTVCHKALAASAVGLFDADISDLGAPSGVASFASLGDKLLAFNFNAAFVTTGTAHNTNQPGDYVVFMQKGPYHASFSTNDAHVVAASLPNVNVSASDTIVCPNQPDTLIATGASTYAWFNTTTNDTLVVPLTASGTYSVVGTSAQGCNDTAYINVSVPYYGITGSVTDLMGPVNSGDVYFYAVNPTSGLYDTIKHVTLFAGGVYLQDSLVTDNYIVQVHLDTTLYPNAVITYNGDEYLWDSVAPVAHNCLNGDTINIQMVEVVNTGGSGYISGYIYEGSGFGQRINQGPGFGVFTNTIPGVPVKVGKNPGGAIVATTISDTSGFYEVGNLPVDNYFVFTDLPGYGMDTLYSISITGSDSLNNLDYFVDSNSVYIPTTMGIHYTPKKNSSLSVYPNPSKDFVTIKTGELNNTNGTFTITDLSGRVVFVSKNNTVQAHSNFTFDFSSLGNSAGTYFMSISGASEKLKIVYVKN